MKIITCIFAFFVICKAAFAQERIPMTLEKSGIYTIPCEVNGLKLKFVFDTGAADVHLSLVEAAFMLKNGYIDKNDFLGTGTYSMADGSISENAMVNLKSITIGKTTIKNVTACISSKIDASLLLGQSAIRKLGKYSIDGSYLVLDNSTASNSISSIAKRDSILYDDKGNIVASNYTGKGKKVFNDGYVIEAKFKNGLQYGKGKWYSTKADFLYEGEFDNGRANGYGIMHNKGKVYEGYFLNSLYHGQGTFTWPNGEKYIGNFVNGYRNGYGTYMWPNGEKYVGYHVKGFFEGKGIWYYSDGSKYEGEFSNDKKNGFGTYTWINGDKYVGNYCDGVRSGKGTYYWNNGDIYEGEFSNDKMTGFGTYTWPSGNRYVGTFSEGYRSGNGTYYYKNGDRYDGIWTKGERTGKGTYFYSDGRKYTGDFVKNEMEGTGTFTWPSGDIYVGEFKNGFRTGYGIYTWKDGAKYQGYWLNGNQEGEGTYYYSNGETKKGIWKNGEYISTSSDYSSSSSTFSSNSSSNGSNGYVDNSYNRTKTYSYNNDNEDDDNYQSSQILSTDDDVDYYLAQVTADLNLREGPGTDYSVVTRIPRGGYVFLSTADAGESFRKVLYVDKNVFGYVSKNYLSNYSKVEVDASGNLQVESKNYKTTADIKIENRTNKTATISIGSLTYTFLPKQTRTIKDIKPGKYKTMASSPGVIPYVGFDTVESGYEYSWVFYIKTVKRR